MLWLSFFWRSFWTALMSSSDKGSSLTCKKKVTGIKMTCDLGFKEMTKHHTIDWRWEIDAAAAVLCFNKLCGPNYYTYYYQSSTLCFTTIQCVLEVLPSCYLPIFNVKYYTSNGRVYLTRGLFSVQFSNAIQWRMKALMDFYHSTTSFWLCGTN